MQCIVYVRFTLEAWTRVHNIPTKILVYGFMLDALKRQAFLLHRFLSVVKQWVIM